MRQYVSFFPNPHIAFPLGFGDMKSQSALAERFVAEEGVWRTVRMDAVAYDDYTKKEVERGGSLDRIFPGITRSMGRLPDPDAPWLYSVTAFAAKNPAGESLLIVPAEEGEIRVEWFDGFHAALDFCAREYGMHPSDFKKP